ncbi:hypothetical protein [Dipodfec virus UOA04_Rod_698]|nr:hypothetical protein [Dipodfec virus UOA04_Rod_698]
MIKVNETFISSVGDNTVLFTSNLFKVKDLIVLPSDCYDCTAISLRIFNYFIVSYNLLLNYLSKICINHSIAKNIKVLPIIDFINKDRPKMCICLEFVNGNINPFTIEYFTDLQNLGIIKEIVVKGRFVFINPTISSFNYSFNK